MKKDSLQIIVFRKKEDNWEFLMLKRVQERGGFWQTISAQIEEGETPSEGAQRELKEETGIEDSLRVIELGDYPNSKGSGTEFAFGFEIGPKVKVCLDCNPEVPEHDEYKWCNLDEALEISEWPQYEEMLNKLQGELK